MQRGFLLKQTRTEGASKIGCTASSPQDTIDCDINGNNHTVYSQSTLSSDTYEQQEAEIDNKYLQPDISTFQQEAHGEYKEAKLDRKNVWGTENVNAELQLYTEASDQQAKSESWDYVTGRKEISEATSDEGPRAETDSSERKQFGPETLTTPSAQLHQFADIVETITPKPIPKNNREGLMTHTNDALDAIHDDDTIEGQNHSSPDTSCTRMTSVHFHGHTGAQHSSNTTTTQAKSNSLLNFAVSDKPSKKSPYFPPVRVRDANGNDMVRITIPGKEKQVANLPIHLFHEYLAKAGNDEEKCVKSLQIHVLQRLHEARKQHELQAQQAVFTHPQVQHVRQSNPISSDRQPFHHLHNSIADVQKKSNNVLSLVEVLSNLRGSAEISGCSSARLIDKSPFAEIAFPGISLPMLCTQSFAPVCIKVCLSQLRVHNATHIFALEPRYPADKPAQATTTVSRVRNLKQIERCIELFRWTDDEHTSGHALEQYFSVYAAAQVKKVYKIRWFVEITRSLKSSEYTKWYRHHEMCSFPSNTQSIHEITGSRVIINTSNIYYDLSDQLTTHMINSEQPKFAPTLVTKWRSEFLVPVLPVSWPAVGTIEIIEASPSSISAKVHAYAGSLQNCHQQKLSVSILPVEKTLKRGTSVLSDTEFRTINATASCCMDILSWFGSHLILPLTSHGLLKRMKTAIHQVDITPNPHDAETPEALWKILISPGHSLDEKILSNTNHSRFESISWTSSQNDAILQTTKFDCTGLLAASPYVLYVSNFNQPLSQNQLPAIMLPVITWTTIDLPKSPVQFKVHHVHSDQVQCSWLPVGKSVSNDIQYKVKHFKLSTKFLHGLQAEDLQDKQNQSTVIEIAQQSAYATAWKRCYTGPDRACTITGLSPNTYYLFRASAHNQKGSSKPSRMRLIHTEMPPPPQPFAPQIINQHIYAPYTAADIVHHTCKVSIHWDLPPVRLPVQQLSFDVQFGYVNNISELFDAYSEPMNTSFEQLDEIKQKTFLKKAINLEHNDPYDINNAPLTCTVHSLHLSDTYELKRLACDRWYCVRVRVCLNTSLPGAFSLWSVFRTVEGRPPSISRFDVSTTANCSIQDIEPNVASQLIYPFHAATVSFALSGGTARLPPEMAAIQVQIRHIANRNVINTEDSANVSELRHVQIEKHAFDPAHFPENMRTLALHISNGLSDKDIHKIANNLHNHASNMSNASNQNSNKDIHAFAIGDEVEIRHPHDKQWYCAKVLSLSYDAETISSSADVELCGLGVEQTVMISNIRRPFHKDAFVEVHLPDSPAGESWIPALVQHRKHTDHHWSYVVRLKVEEISTVQQTVSVRVENIRAAESSSALDEQSLRQPWRKLLSMHPSLSHNQTPKNLTSTHSNVSSLQYLRLENDEDDIDIPCKLAVKSNQSLSTTRKLFEDGMSHLHTIRSLYDCNPGEANCLPSKWVTLQPIIASKISIQASKCSDTSSRQSATALNNHRSKTIAKLLLPPIFIPGHRYEIRLRVLDKSSLKNLQSSQKCKSDAHARAWSKCMNFECAATNSGLICAVGAIAPKFISCTHDTVRLQPSGIMDDCGSKITHLNMQVYSIESARETLSAYACSEASIDVSQIKRSMIMSSASDLTSLPTLAVAGLKPGQAYAACCVAYSSQCPSRPSPFIYFVTKPSAPRTLSKRGQIWSTYPTSNSMFNALALVQEFQIKSQSMLTSSSAAISTTAAKLLSRLKTQADNASTSDICILTPYPEKTSELCGARLTSIDWFVTSDPVDKPAKFASELEQNIWQRTLPPPSEHIMKFHRSSTQKAVTSNSFFYLNSGLSPFMFLIGCKPGSNYYVSTRFQTSYGPSEWSELSTISAASLPPGIPSNPEISKVSHNKAEFSWNQPNDHGNKIIGYTMECVPLYLKELNVQSRMPQNIDPFKTYKHEIKRQYNAATTHNKIVQGNFAGLASDTAYLFRVAAVNDVAQGQFSCSCSFYTDNTPESGLQSPGRLIINSCKDVITFISKLKSKQLPLCQPRAANAPAKSCVYSINSNVERFVIGVSFKNVIRLPSTHQNDQSKFCFEIHLRATLVSPDDAISEYICSELTYNAPLFDTMALLLIPKEFCSLSDECENAFCVSDVSLRARIVQGSKIGSFSSLQYVDSSSLRKSAVVVNQTTLETKRASVHIIKQNQLGTSSLKSNSFARGTELRCRKYDDTNQKKQELGPSAPLLSINEKREIAAQRIRVKKKNKRKKPCSAHCAYAWERLHCVVVLPVFIVIMAFCLIAFQMDNFI